MIVFLGVRALPGDPALALGGENRDPEVLASIRHDYGLDQPLPIQYVTWIGHVLRGDLGTDQRKLPVGHTIVTRLPITLELAFLAVLFGSLIGIVAGIIAATRRGKTSDYAATSVALVGPLGAALLARAAPDRALLRPPRSGCPPAATSRSSRTRSRTCATCCCRRSCSGRA